MESKIKSSALSLNNMYNFLANDFNNLSTEEQQYFDVKTFDVIENYLFGHITNALASLLKLPNNNLENKPQKTFYLGGQIKLPCDKEITQADIDTVQKQIDTMDISECWGMEIYSTLEHKKKFDKFKVFYKNYTEFINHKLHEPGSSNYFEAMNHFNNTLEQV
jgi:hypothetical protein